MPITLFSSTLRGVVCRCVARVTVSRTYKRNWPSHFPAEEGGVRKTLRDSSTMCQRVREADPTSSGERQESQRQDKQNN